MRFALNECKETWIIIGGIFVISVLLAIILPFYYKIAISFMISCGLLFLVILFFFRDPKREPIKAQNAILSPADGTVLGISEEEENDFLKEKVKKISIFLSLFDVHIQRAPMSGSIEFFKYVPGRFHPAWKKSASEKNERNFIGIKNEDFKILLCQIAGTLARRTVTWVKTGDRINAGERIGLIKFGSRVEIFIPKNVVLNIKIKDKVKAGETVIGTCLKDKDSL